MIKWESVISSPNPPLHHSPHHSHCVHLVRTESWSRSLFEKEKRDPSSSLPFSPFVFIFPVFQYLFSSDRMIPVTHQAFIFVNTCMGLNKRGLSSSSLQHRQLSPVVSFPPFCSFCLFLLVLFFLSLSSSSPLFLWERRGNERGVR